MTAIGKTDYYLGSQEDGACRPGHSSQHQGVRRRKESLGKSLYCGLHRKGWARKE